MLREPELQHSASGGPDEALHALSTRGADDTGKRGPAAGRSCLARLVDAAGLRDTEPDADGLYDGLILPRQQYMYLWALAWMSFASAVVAVARGYWDLAIVPAGVWLTSILYWHKPDYSWRRYVDMGWVQLALWYQVYRAVGAENMVPFYVIMAFAVASFPVGVYFHGRREVWLCTLCHGVVHILGNVGNMTLYAGTVLPPPRVSYLQQAHGPPAAMT